MAQPEIGRGLGQPGRLPAPLRVQPASQMPLKAARRDVLVGLSVTG